MSGSLSHLMTNLNHSSRSAEPLRHHAAERGGGSFALTIGLYDSKRFAAISNNWHSSARRGLTFAPADCTMTDTFSFFEGGRSPSL